MWWVTGWHVDILGHEYVENISVKVSTLCGRWQLDILNHDNLCREHFGQCVNLMWPVTGRQVNTLSHAYVKNILVQVSALWVSDISAGGLIESWIGKGQGGLLPLKLGKEEYWPIRISSNVSTLWVGWHIQGREPLSCVLVRKLYHGL